MDLEEQTENIMPTLWLKKGRPVCLKVQPRQVLPTYQGRGSSLKECRVILSKEGETEADSPQLKQKKINTQMPTYKIEICLAKYFINMDSSRMRPFNAICDSIYMKGPEQANL